MTEEQRKEAHAFYKEALELLNESGVRYMLGGAFAMFHYTEIYRDTKDLDIFCKPSDYPKIMKHFADKGYKTDLYDIRWLAKVYKGDYFIDILVENAVILELKSVERHDPVFEAQILSYMKLTGKNVGLLINFNSKMVKDGIKRFVL